MNRRDGDEIARLEKMLEKREAKVKDAKKKLKAARERAKAVNRKT